MNTFGSHSGAKQVRQSWSHERGQDAERLLAIFSAAGGSDFVDAAVADAEERWDRGLDATPEHYQELIPRAFEGEWGDQLLRAILMCEVVRRRTETFEAVRKDVEARFADRPESVGAVLAMAELVGEWEVEEALRKPVAHAGMEVGKYKLLERLGAGSFGEVWRAWDSELDRHVAIKLLDSGSGDSSKGGRAFVAEAQAAAGLDHEHVVRVHAAGWFQELGRFFIDSQLVAEAAPTPDDPHAVEVGRSLEMAVKRDGVFKPRVAAELMERVCRGVAAAHGRGILHRDIKPSNVLLMPSGRPLVADFGLSISGLSKRLIDGAQSGGSGAASGARHTVSVATESGGRIVGTPAFMSPEQANGRAATPATDVFGLGATLRWALTGEAAYAPTGKFHADNTKDVIEQAKRAEMIPLSVAKPDVPATLAAICDRAMSRDVSVRYVSADQLAGELSAWLGHRPTMAVKESASGKFALWYRRNVAAATVGLVAMVVASAMTVWFVQRVMSERDRAVEAERLSIAARDKAILQREIAEAVNRFSSETLSTSLTVQGFQNELKLFAVLDLADRRLETYRFESPLIEAGVRHAVGQSLNAVGAAARARVHLERALEIREKLLGKDAPDTLRTRRQLGLTFTKRTETAEFNRLAEQSAADFMRVMGPDDPETWVAAFMRARVRSRSDADLAYPEMEQAIAELKRTAGPASLDRLWAMNYFVRYLRLRDREKATAMTREMLAGYQASFGPEELDTLLAKRRLADYLQEDGETEEAEELLRSAWETAKRTLAPNTTHRILTSYELAETIIMDGYRYAEGLEVLRELRPVVAELDPRWAVSHKIPLLEGYAMWKLDGDGTTIAKVRDAHDALVKHLGANSREAVEASRLLAEIYRAEGDDMGMKRLYEQHPPARPKESSKPE